MNEKKRIKDIRINIKKANEESMKATIEVKFNFQNIGAEEIEEILDIVTPMHIRLVYVGDCDKNEREKIYKLLNISGREINNLWEKISYPVKIKKLKRLGELEKVR